MMSRFKIGDYFIYQDCDGVLIGRITSDKVSYSNEPDWYCAYTKIRDDFNFYGKRFCNTSKVYKHALILKNKNQLEIVKLLYT